MQRMVYAWIAALAVATAGSARADEAGAPPGGTEDRDEAGGAEPPDEPEAAPRWARHVVYAELGGAAGIYSLNYEHHVFETATARVGGMYIPVNASAGEASGRVTWTALPLTVNYLGWRYGPHALELGAGAVPMHLSGEATVFGYTLKASGVFVGATATAGYRYTSPDGGIVFRAGLTPIWMQGFTLPWGGMSLGYRF